MPVYYTPGVYFEKIDAAKRKIPAIRTEIPGFVGIAEKGPLNTALKLESWKQYQSVFGGFIPQGYLSYAVYGFFENGGNTCYVVRISDIDSAKKAEATLLDKNNIPTIKIYALNEGQWGNKIKVSLKEASIGSTITAEPSKQPADKKYSIVKSITGFEKGSLVKAFQNKNGTTVEDYHYVESIDILSKKILWDSPLNAGFDLNKPIYFRTIEFTLTFSLNNKFREVHENLSLNKDHSRYLENTINGQSNLVTVLVTVKDLSYPSSIPNNLPDPQKFKKGYLYLEGGVDGMSSIDIYDFIGDPTLKGRGLRCYEDVDEVSMICIPDIMIQPVEIELPLPAEKPDPCAMPEEEIETYTPAKPEPIPMFSADDIERVQRAIIDHCELLKDRVAILDPPFNFDVLQIYEWRQKFNSKYAVLYYPWIIVNDPLRIKGNITRLIPPSGHIAGVYARTDLTKGVHKAPANEEVFGAKDTSIRVEDSEQDILNPEGINCLRAFPGRGILVWGARTVSRDPIWRYINIRRLLIMIEESVEEAMQWAVFEPNDAYLRNGINVAVSSFLEELWRQGALAGKTAAEAFFVKCDEENNPRYVIDAGRIITDIGVAPSIPGEFIVFRIGKVKDGIGFTKEGV